jgi:hypothetical protein
MKAIKNTLLVLLFVSQGCLASSITNVDDQKNDQGSTVVIEVSPQKKEVSIEYTARPFDALDRFVKTLSRADFEIAVIRILFASGKILMFNELPGLGYHKLAFLTVTALGLAKVVQYLQYYGYLFVRGGLGYLAPRKIVRAVNERLVSYEERFPNVIDFAAILYSFSASVYRDYLKSKLAANPLYYISNF